MTIEGQKEFLLKWNYYFPADKWWRQKYNIPLFSEQHLSVSQIDIALEYLEESMFEDYSKQNEKKRQVEEEYKKGKWLIDRDEVLSNEEESNLFDKLDVLNFKDSKIGIKDDE